MGFEPVTFGTAAWHSTAEVGSDLGDMGDRGTILLLMTYDPPNNKCHLDGESIQHFMGRLSVLVIDGNHRDEKYGRRRGFLCII